MCYFINRLASVSLRALRCKFSLLRGQMIQLSLAAGLSVVSGLRPPPLALPTLGSTTTSQKPPFFDFPSTSSKPDQVPKNTNRRNSVIFSMWSPSAWVARDHPLPPFLPIPTLHSLLTCPGGPLTHSLIILLMNRRQHRQPALPSWKPRPRQS